MFQQKEQLLSLITELDQAIISQNLLRKDGYLVSNPNSQCQTISLTQNHYLFFHASLYLSAVPCSFPSFQVENGNIAPFFKEMEELNHISSFDLSQFQAEHSGIGENLFLDGNAGTGKTTTILNRILFLWHSSQQDMSDFLSCLKIIFFSSEAKAHFKIMLKKHLDSAYHLTQQKKYLLFLRNLDFLHSSTVTELALQSLSDDYRQNFHVTEDFSLLKQLISSYCHTHFTALSQNQTSPSIPIKTIETLIFSLVTGLYQKNIDVSSLDIGLLGEITPPYAYVKQFIHNSLSNIAISWENALLSNKTIHKIQMMPYFLRQTPPVTSCTKKHSLFIDGLEQGTEADINVLYLWIKQKNPTLFISRNKETTALDNRQLFSELLQSRTEQLWKFLSLSKNYRTDKTLVTALNQNFSQGNFFVFEEKNMLKNQNHYVSEFPSKFYRCLEIEHETQRFHRIFKEISRINRRIAYETKEITNEEQGDKRIALIVETKTQVKELTKLFQIYQLNLSCFYKRNLAYYDLKLLLEGLLFDDQPLPLFSLANSSFFFLNIQKSEIHQIKNQDQASPAEFLKKQIQKQFALVNNSGFFVDWSDFEEKMFSTSVLNYIFEFYTLTKPWLKSSHLPNMQKEYQINTNKLFSLFQKENIKTLSQLYDFLRNDFLNLEEYPGDFMETYEQNEGLFCLTAEESIGFEFAHVILPFSDQKIQEENVQIVNQSAGKIHYAFPQDWNFPPFENFVLQKKSENSQLQFLYQATSRTKCSLTWVQNKNLQERTNQFILRKVEEHGI